MNIQPLFPIPVGKFELGREFTFEENEFVSSQPTVKNTGNTTSINNYVLNSEMLSGLTAFVQTSVNEYFKSVYAPKEDVSLRVTQSWLNYSKPGEWHHKHAHPNSFISGVLYMKAAKERDRIYFYNETFRQIDIPTENFNLFNSPTWWLPVNTGDLIMFPSSLNHSVDAVKEEERISLSFNTFPVGYLGREENLTGLHLRD